MRPDYSFCRRALTVYNPVWAPGGALTVRRCVLPRAFLAPGRSFAMGSAYAGSGLTGASSKEEFLLVVPVEERPDDAGAGGIFALESEWRFLPGVEFEALADKAGHFTLGRSARVFDGIGPVVKDAAGWERFVPALADGVYEIGRVALRRGADGCPVHIEGGA